MAEKPKRRVKVYTGNTINFRTGFVLSETDTTIRIRVNLGNEMSDITFDKATKAAKSSRVKNWFPMKYAEQ